MKEFRKDKQGHFICEECNLICKTRRGLSKHVNRFHIQKEYYNKWIKEENEGFCKVCRNETPFINFKLGYKLCCCKKCVHTHSKDSNLKISNTLKHKFASKEIIPNMKGAHSKKSRKKQSLTKQGKKLSEQHKQNIKFSLHNSQKFKNCFNEERSNKIKQTNLKKYGVENPTQNEEIFRKQQKNAYYSKKYKNTSIYYRGSYEFNFLENYYVKILDIQNAPSFKYKFLKRDTIYFPDFFIPSMNLIIEIKNSYLAKKDKEKIKTKENAVIDSGFKISL